MPGNNHKKGPDSAGGNGSRASSGRDFTRSIAPRPPTGKIQLPHDPAPLAMWPRPDDAFADQLRADPDYVWRRMMRSVCPEPEALKPC